MRHNRVQKPTHTYKDKGGTADLWGKDTVLNKWFLCKMDNHLSPTSHYTLKSIPSRW